MSETKLCQEKINNGYLLINLHQGNSFVVTFVSADLIEGVRKETAFYRLKRSTVVVFGWQEFSLSRIL